MLFKSKADKHTSTTSSSWAIGSARVRTGFDAGRIANDIQSNFILASHIVYGMITLSIFKIITTIQAGLFVFHDTTLGKTAARGRSRLRNMDLIRHRIPVASTSAVPNV